MRRTVKTSLLVLLLMLLQSRWPLRAETAAIHLYQRFGSGDELRYHLPFHTDLLELCPAGPSRGWFLEGQSSRGSTLDRLLSDWIYILFLICPK